MKIWLKFALIIVSAFVTNSRSWADTNLAGTASPDGLFHVATIQSSRQIRLYLAHGADWKPEIIEVADELLVPGAPLEIRIGVKDESRIISVLTVSTQGDILSIIATRDANGMMRVESASLADATEKFPLAADFAFVKDGARRRIFAVSLSGKLIEVDLDAKSLSLVEGRDDAVLPGGSIRTHEGQADELFLIDRRGNLVSYTRDPIRSWKGPQLIATGFLAGAPLVVWKRPDGSRETYVSAINSRGEVRVARRETAGWRNDVAPGWIIPAGSPVSVFHTPGGLRLFAVNSHGMLGCMHLVNTEWRDRFIAYGNGARTTAYLPTQAPTALSIDAAGDLLTSTATDDIWSSMLTANDGSLPRSSVLQRSVGDAPVTTQSFQLRNRSAANVVLKIRDTRHPDRVAIQALAAGESPTQSFDQLGATTLTTKLKPSPAAGAEAKDVEPVERKRDIPGYSPYELEIVKTGPGIPYLDERLHRFPRIQPSEQAEICVGRFQLPLKWNQESQQPIQIDAVESAKRRSAVVIP